MSEGLTVLLGAISGFTILLGLPVARLGRLSRSTQGYMNALATGILVFLLWDVLSGAGEPVEAALESVGGGGAAHFLLLLAMFALGLTAGLLSLVALTAALRRRPAPPSSVAATADAAGGAAAGAPGRRLALMIAIGLGLHNFSEGLAIGQSAAAGTIAFALTLIIGFGLHNITEGFGIAAPMASDGERPSWGYLLLLGVVGGGPTFVGTVLGFRFTSEAVFVLFLTLAAGALIYVVDEMLAVGRTILTRGALYSGLLVGFFAGFGTDLLLKYLGG